MVALPRWLRLGRRARPRADFNTIWSNPQAWEPNTFGGARSTASGESVTDEKAMALSAYYACLRNGSDDVAKLPRRLFKRLRDKRDGSAPQDDHPVAHLLRLPNPMQTWGVFCCVMQMRRMGWGNGYAEIVRDGMGTPLALWPLHPSRVAPKLDGEKLVYEVTEDGGTKKPLPARNVFHIRNMGDGVQGYSLLRAAAEALGIGLAAQKHAGAFYAEGMGKQMVAFVKGPTLSTDARTALRKRIVGDRERNPDGVRQLKIIDGLEVDLRDAGINPDEAQFLEQREFTVEEIARFCRMPLSKIQYHKRAQGWGTLDALNTDYVVDFILPNVQTWEEECWLKLLLDEERADYYVKWIVQGLLRGDSASRIAYYGAGIKDGWLSQNDIRRLEDMQPIDDDAADQYRMQAQMVPLAMPEDEEEPAETETAAPSPPVPPIQMQQPEEPEPDEDEPGPEARFALAVDGMRPIVVAACETLVRGEVAAATRAMTKRSGNKVAFAAWECGYYEDWAGTVADALAPVGAALEWQAASLGLRGVGAGRALLAIVPAYRQAVTPADDEGRRVSVLTNLAMDALTRDVTRKEPSNA